ncbi:MmcQ/YjbR family DNA-binding protein [Kocuria sp. JC486]|uniref:MmcQ/YjbR family DNA-binding protein n=1 Tax=Kocuria sp. JC486 TaxID=1970736 RepID=UPI0014243132|nr:MmcQ/YjbR family DNA-binding protein [Kocuria sp. JC486]NHU84317.1 MmcQ/YjbR family DNA-binding protein [Kocuria sp. JC486]
MDGHAIQDRARRTALELPGADKSYPFGPEHEVFKVRGKVFLMCTDVTGEPIITFKCEPEDSFALRQQYPSISPGYHMNKKHWVSVAGHESVTARLVEEMVEDAYRLVVEKLPKAQRPLITDRLR